MSDFPTAADFANQTDAVMIEVGKTLLLSSPYLGTADIIAYSGSIGFCNYFESRGFVVDIHMESNNTQLPFHTVIGF